MLCAAASRGWRRAVAGHTMPHGSSPPVVTLARRHETGRGFPQAVLVPRRRLLLQRVPLCGWKGAASDFDFVKTSLVCQ
jgi:hypothetical protein